MYFADISKDLGPAPDQMVFRQPVPKQQQD